MSALSNTTEPDGERTDVHPQPALQPKFLGNISDERLEAGYIVLPELSDYRCRGYLRGPRATQRGSGDAQGPRAAEPNTLRRARRAKDLVQLTHKRLVHVSKASANSTQV